MIDWNKVKIDAAISAMQGVLESGKLGDLMELAPELVAKQSIRMADALVNELRAITPDTDEDTDAIFSWP